MATAKKTVAAETAEQSVQQQVPVSGSFAPYEATVAISMVAVRKKTTGTPIGFLGEGTKVTVIGSVDGFAILRNGTYVKETYLDRIKQ